jgi:hypothetical protein
VGWVQTGVHYGGCSIDWSSDLLDCDFNFRNLFTFPAPIDITFHFDHSEGQVVLICDPNKLPPTDFAGAAFVSYLDPGIEAASLLRYWQRDGTKQSTTYEQDFLQAGFSTGAFQPPSFNDISMSAQYYTYGKPFYVYQAGFCKGHGPYEG